MLAGPDEEKWVEFFKASKQAENRQGRHYCK
jgi:hypothetical protein